MAEGLSAEDEAASEATIASDNTAITIALDQARGRRGKSGGAAVDAFLGCRDDLVI
jgi:hypothetical protein